MADSFIRVPADSIGKRTRTNTRTVNALEVHEQVVIPLKLDGTEYADNLLDRYYPSDLDNTANLKYYGFLASDGSWYIMCEDTEAGQYRYAAGISSYPAAWTARVGQPYDYFNVTF